MDRRRSEHRGSCGGFGEILRRWRRIRGISQLSLAAETDTSSRHLSFVETGRAAPSRELVLRLAEALDMPLRGRNELLVAAGYAAMFRESTLNTPPLDGVRRALEFTLAQQTPYPAIVVQPDWTVIMANESSVAWRRLFLTDSEMTAAAPASGNAMKMFFDPRLLRPFVTNWESCARQILLRLRHETASAGPASPPARLLRELLACPGASEALAGLGGGLPPNDPLMTVHMARGNVRLSYFSMLATFGTPHDTLLEELRIKTFFPADAASAALFQHLVARQEAHSRRSA